ncbi:MAG: cytochrome c family protein [Proteobacteria bacterium]|nr:cytochrome c family protein [Pseudomonadota bacterium]
MDGNAFSRHRVNWLVTALGLVVVACQPRVSATPVTSADPSAEKRFPHGDHNMLACTDCHGLDAVLRGDPAVPGARDHAPCDRAQCHQSDFLSLPGSMCAVCHEAVDPTRSGGSPLAPYPPEYSRRVLPSQFSHQKHLDFERIEARVGFHVTCEDCHTRDDAGRPTAARHGVCGRCHAPEAAPPGTPPMNLCAQCHRPGHSAIRRQRRLITGDLHFDHGNHARDRRGTPIRCVECHTASPNAHQIGDHPTPVTRVCVGCHDDFDRTPSSSRMYICQTCHRKISRYIGILAPRSHLPPLERPEDHTLAFRRDHAADARADSQRCARCHTFMSGQSRDTCDECHQIMQPSDHVITWTEYDHGPAASARADRCALCHRSTFCVACHSRLPRSHLPLNAFRINHGLPARLRLRSCLTCHNPGQSCDRCHLSQGMAR